MRVTYFNGMGMPRIDISKASFDVALCQHDKPASFIHQKFSNSLAGCKQLLTWLKKQKVNLPEAFFIMEHTGWYTLELCCFLQERN